MWALTSARDTQFPHSVLRGRFDIAVRQIPKPEDGQLPTVKLGDSDRLRVGDEVLVIGNPLGLDQSLTRGIVSATNRILPPTFFSLQEPTP